MTSSRSPTPEIAVSPPTPGEELDLSAVVGGISLEQPEPETVAKDDVRKHTNMGWPDRDFTYIALSEEKAAVQLERLAVSQVSNGGTLHTTTLQPHPDPEKHNQDRYFAESWNVAEHGTWKFRAIFDGHAAGDETVDHVFSTLPSKIRASLVALPSSDLANVEAITSLLRNTISSADEGIKQGVLDLFPSPEDIEKLSDEEIQAIVNDRSTSDDQVHGDADVIVPSSTGPTILAKKYAGRGPNNIKITRAMRGTTVLIVLISPDGGIWTASLGDCQAVLGQKSQAQETRWTTTLLSVNHNASEPSEIMRLKLDHPGEEEDVIVKNRVLGIIAVTRAIGDFQFKLPSIYTKRIFSLTVPGMNRPETNIQLMVERNKTPPYVSGIPEVGYVKLEKGAKAFLIMCSDGLTDLHGGENWQEENIEIANLVKDLVDLVGGKLDSSSSADLKENLALFLLQRGLRGPAKTKAGERWTEDDALDRVSSLLTLEFKDKWMDDTTVLVEVL
ncbi:hypothetical protein GYMLUDRAFT_38408 [Collybiopsis luxurians FD-317 M1]|nr:hypothetical protein GYMLUDRAFT_38408 [Collybiopsis luxurians FD-317 M1]